MAFEKYKKSRSLFAHPAPKVPEKRSWLRNAGAVLWRALKSACLLIGAMVLLSALISAVTFARLSAAPPALPDEMVLYLELEDGLFEIPEGPDFSAPFAPSAPTLYETIKAIDTAAIDPRVKGMMARMRDGAFEPAHIEELRAAIARFRAAGKFTHIYSDSYGGFGGGLGRYYLASAFEDIWLQPMGMVSITGISIDMPYLRAMLEKIGVTPQFFKRKDYKSVNEMFTNEEMSPQSRETLGALIKDLAGSIMGDIAADRALNPDYLKARIDEGLFTADKALEARLIDMVGYVDVLADNIVERITGERDSEEQVFVHFAHYAQAGVKPRVKQKQDVALIYAVGAIMETGAAPGIAAADEIAPAIMEAAHDDDVRAIVLRIDSPGGSPVASETILRALHKAKEKSKIITVSMGPVAASGGYWIAMAAERIFVSPTTITGSIGVAGGKFVLRDLWQKIGVNWDGLAWGDNAGMWSFNEEFSASQQARFEMMLDHIYDSFITRVADNRGMSEDAVDALAGGRVWSGRAALENGLADQAGGLAEALDYTAMQLMGEDATRKNLNVIIMPRPLDLVEQIAQMLGAQVAIGQWWQDIRTQLGLLETANALTYMPLSVE